MINLIPPPAKRAMKREYWMRVLIVWLLLLNGVLILAAILTAPSFVLVTSQLQAYESQMQLASAAAEEQQQLVTTVKEANGAAATAYRIGSVQHIVPYLTRINQIRGNQIVLRHVSATRDQNRAVATIEVAGVAATRQALTTFSQALEADPLFTEAYVPLSNLAAQEDISFQVSVQIASVE